MGDEDLRGLGEALGEQVGDPTVLNQGGVAGLRQPRLVNHLEPALEGDGDAAAGFGRPDHYLVAEPVELLGDGDQVGLAAAEAEVVGGEDESHESSTLVTES